MSRRKRLPAGPVTVDIETLSHEGRGIGHVDGKTVFVDEALPGEKVSCQYTRVKSRYSEARIVDILQASADRITAGCEFYGVCGGCSFQHVSPQFQVQHKQNAMLDLLQRTAGLQPEQVLPPLTGPVWGYRRRARLGVKYVEKKQKLLVGFREKNSPFIADINHCEVLHPAVGQLIEPLQELIGGLTVYRQLPQIEVAVGDTSTVLVLRHLAALSAEDESALRSFETQHTVRFYLQAAGPDSVRPLSPERQQPLAYDLSGHDIRFEFLPTDFIQVNAAINRQMIDLALSLLQPAADERVLDLFCGLGNFSLPLAKVSQHVTAVEGDAGLVGRAVHNAELNAVRNITFHALDLAAAGTDAAFLQQHYDKVLLDPPRSGADLVLRQLPLQPVRALLYVSCNPATLARDAAILVNEKGFRLQAAGVMDMFPHTTHVESIALFVR